ncbi:MAG: GAF domain-containing protein, partial [Chloroflexi bacterium]|nr:GAF domain-containing protein [Chloroflexota bacterium]
MNLNRILPDNKTEESTGIVYKNWREHFVGPMLIGALVFGALALIPALLTNQGWFQNTVFIFSYLVLLIVAFVRFPYWLRMGVFLFIVYSLGLNELISTGVLGDGIFFFLGLIIFATMMFSPRAGMFATAITLITFVVMGGLTLSGRIGLLSSDAMTAKVTDWLSAAATTLLFSATIILGLRQLQIEFLDAQKQTANALNQLEKERGSLEERVQERTLQLKAVNEVGRAASAILNTDELIARVVNLITDQFGYYYTAIFISDEKGEWAELHNATGEAGHVLRENKHRLRIGGNSMVGTAIATGKARIALDTGAESTRFENPLLPYTRSEIALPLIIGDRVLGALDVQSTQESTFGPQEIETLQGMVNQVAIAFENARLFQEAQRNLEEMQSLQRQYVLNAWKPLSENSDLNYQVGDEDSSSSAVNLQVPLTLRDEIIGQISLAGETE